MGSSSSCSSLQRGSEHCTSLAAKHKCNGVNHLVIMLVLNSYRESGFASSLSGPRLHSAAPAASVHRLTCFRQSVSTRSTLQSAVTASLVLFCHARSVQSGPSIRLWDLNRRSFALQLWSLVPVLGTRTTPSGRQCPHSVVCPHGDSSLVEK